MSLLGRLREVALLGFGISISPILFIPWFSSWILSHVLCFIIGKRAAAIFINKIDEYLMEIYYRTVVLIFEQLSPCRVSLFIYVSSDYFQYLSIAYYKMIN